MKRLEAEVGMKIEQLSYEALKSPLANLIVYASCAEFHTVTIHPLHRQPAPLPNFG